MVEVIAQATPLSRGDSEMNDRIITQQGSEQTVAAFAMLIGLTLPVPELSSGKAACTHVTDEAYSKFTREERQASMERLVIDNLVAAGASRRDISEAASIMHAATDRTGIPTQPFSDFMRATTQPLPPQPGFDATCARKRQATFSAADNVVGEADDAGFTGATLRGLLGYRRSIKTLAKAMELTPSSPTVAVARAALVYMDLLIALRTMTTGQLRARYSRTGTTPHVRIQELLKRSYHNGALASFLDRNIPRPLGESGWSVRRWAEHAGCGSLKQHGVYREHLLLSAKALVMLATDKGVLPSAVLSVVIDPRTKTSLTFARSELADPLLSAGVVTDAHRARYAADLTVRELVAKAELMREFMASVDKFGPDPLVAMRAGSVAALNSLRAWVTIQSDARMLHLYTKKEIALTSSRVLELGNSMAQAYREKWPASSRPLLLPDIVALSAVKPLNVGGLQTQAPATREIVDTASYVSPVVASMSPMRAWSSSAFKVLSASMSDGATTTTVTVTEAVTDDVTVQADGTATVKEEEMTEIAMTTTVMADDSHVPDDYEAVRCLTSPDYATTVKIPEYTSPRCIHDHTSGADPGDSAVTTTIGDFTVIEEEEEEEADNGPPIVVTTRAAVKKRKRTLTIRPTSRGASLLKEEEEEVHSVAAVQVKKAIFDPSKQVTADLMASQAWANHMSKARAVYSLAYPDADAALAVSDSAVLKELVLQKNSAVFTISTTLPGMDDEGYRSDQLKLLEETVRSVARDLYAAEAKSSVTRYANDVVLPEEDTLQLDYGSDSDSDSDSSYGFHTSDSSASMDSDYDSDYHY